MGKRGIINDTSEIGQETNRGILHTHKLIWGISSTIFYGNFERVEQIGR